MAKRKVNYIFYYYMHSTLLNHFKENCQIGKREVSIYLSKRFGLGRIIRNRVLSEIRDLGFVREINSDYVAINKLHKNNPFGKDILVSSF